eukprot:gb/GECG01007450.1/.p1 GENE.gb/GECG01007450.1/~~gb/GECG01007450.1/.p1  ORF type:complete len:476 (+),score=51.06 gb/GECG01007450.1/:1-1428(+)
MSGTLDVLKAAGSEIEPVPIRIGKEVYESGYTSGITPEAWKAMQEHKVILKAPITTPQGDGYKSLNVSIRKNLGLFANVRPVVSLAPFVKTNHPDLDLVIVRENEEDLYGGIEHQQTPEVVQTLKLVSRPGCERIVRYAFEHARVYGRKKVTCMTKDNIMKHTDGLFHQVFTEISQEYPEIETEHQIIDIGTAQLADNPSSFDVIVTLNLYGDIISDVAAQVSGSVGLAGSANIGKEYAMFEAIHGSAPAIAGKDMANPSGLLSAAVSMLVHVGEAEVADRTRNAWLRTIEDGIHTADIHQEGISKKLAGCKEFTQAIIDRMGKFPRHFPPAHYTQTGDRRIQVREYTPKQTPRDLVGMDVFVYFDERNAETLGKRIEAALPDQLQLKMITNRGTKVYPNAVEGIFCTDHWRCRIVSKDARVFEEGEKTAGYPKVNYDGFLKLMQNLHGNGIEVIKTENLYYIDNNRAFSLGQGE